MKNEDNVPSMAVVPIFFLMLYSLSYCIHYFDLLGKWYGFPTYILLVLIHIMLGMALYIPFSKNK